MKILIDMNLSPEWVQEFNSYGFESVHWSAVGEITALDSTIMSWARTANYVIFTHDLDFGTALALTKAEKPSLIQVRTQNVTVSYLSKIVIQTILKYKDTLETGALLVLDDEKKRIRILPL